MSGDSYNQDKAIAAHLTGETSNGMPFLENLSTLNLLGKMYGNDHPGIAALKAEEGRYILPAMNMIGTNPFWQSKLGHDMDAVKKLIPMLRQEQAQKTLSQMLQVPGGLPDQREYVKEAIKTGIKFK